MFCIHRFSRLAAFGLVAACVAASSAPAHAYKMMQTNSTGRLTSLSSVDCNSTSGFVHLNSRTLNWYHNTSGQGAGQAAPIQAAMTAWNNVSTSDFTLNYSGTTSAGFTTDGTNTLSWGTDTVCDSKSCHALTAVVVQSGQVIVESDIIFNSNPTLNLQWVNSAPYDPCAEPDRTNNRVDVQGVATHEFGHSLGLHHPASATASIATMGGVSCNSEARTLEADDIAGLECAENRYPYSPSYEGYHENNHCWGISGWAWNSNRPNQPSYVQIKEGSTVHAVVPANLYRADLVSAGKGNGVHGFSWDPGLNDGQFHTLTLQHTGTNGNLTWTNQEIICRAEMFADLFPDDIIDTGGQVYTIATQFSSSKAGYITDLYYYKAKGETGTSTIRLWTDGGSVQLASLPVDESCSVSASSIWPGRWCGGPITPVAITAGTKYRVGVNANTKHSKTGCGLSPPITSGSLTAHTSYWIAGNAFPTTNSCSNFFVDVRFDM